MRSSTLSLLYTLSTHCVCLVTFTLDWPNALEAIKSSTTVSLFISFILGQKKITIKSLFDDDFDIVNVIITFYLKKRECQLSEAGTSQNSLNSPKSLTKLLKTIVLADTDFDFTKSLNSIKVLKAMNSPVL